MSSDYHTPHAFGAPLTAAELNTPLGELDAAIGAIFNVSVINVTDPTYGAVGDGVADDTAAIQSAFDACHAAGGGVVYLPKGTYLVSDTIELPYPARVLGDGRNLTYINYTGAASSTAIRFKNFATSAQRPYMEIGQFTIVNTGSNTGITVMNLKGISLSYVHDIYMSGFGGASVGILVDASYGSSIGAWWNTFERIVTVAQIGTGIKFTGVVSGGQANENVVRDCRFVGATVAGAHVEVGDNVIIERSDFTTEQGGTGVILQHRHGVVRQCRFEGCTEGVRISAATGTLAGNLVTDNFFVGNSGAANTTNYGIRVDSGAIHSKLERNHFTGTYLIKRIKDDTSGNDSTDLGRCFPFVFAVQNMAASQSSTAVVPVGADSGNTRLYLSRPYAIRGLGVRMNAVPSAGTLAFHPTIGGTDTTLVATWSSGSTFAAFQGRGVDEDSLGSNGLGLSYTTNGAFTATTIDATIIVWVEFLDDTA